MTVSTSQSQITFLGNGVTTSFSWAFNSGVPTGQTTSQATYTVIYTDTTGKQTTLAPSTFTLSFTAAAAGNLWGNGGTLSYPNVGSPIANNTTLTLIRTFPLTQTTSISNQGDFAPQVIEEALDTLEMQMQQISGRTTQFRGTWATGNVYNPGDIVQDGANGANTSNYYICLIGNISGVWATDLGAGDWAISVVATVPMGITALTGDVTGSGTGSIATTIGANKVTLAKIATIPSNTFLGNNTGATATVASLTIAQLNTALGSVISANVQKFTSSATYTPTAGMVFCQIEVWGGGGGGGGTAATSSGSNAGGGGAGGYDKLTATAATVGASQAVVIGAGGTAGANTGGTGGTGGTTSVGALVQATGGAGGVGNNATQNGVAGGAGGVGSGGSYSATGQPGGIGPYCSGVAVWFSGAGGASSLGGNGIAAAYTSGTLALAGNNAVANSGSGGSGSMQANGNSAHIGGVGGSGYVVITEYIS